MGLILKSNKFILIVTVFLAVLTALCLVDSILNIVSSYNLFGVLIWEDLYILTWIPLAFLIVFRLTVLGVRKITKS